MELITHKICMTRDIGVHGNLFGGMMLAWVDEAAAALATKVCHTPNMVTIKIEEVVFKKAVKVGMQIHIYGEVSHVGNTSISMKMEARKYNVYSGEETVVCTTNITFVRIDENGDAVPIPSLVKDRYAELG
jgi:acyl-CoA thioesterase YciA